METHPSAGPRVRWLVAGPLLPGAPGGRFRLTREALAQRLGPAVRGLDVTVGDRIGAGDASTWPLSLGDLDAFQLARVIDSLPDLRVLGALRGALSGARPLAPEETARLQATLGRGRLAQALAEVHRTSGNAPAALLAVLEEALFSTARDLLQHPLVARLESAWRGLAWLEAHCPAPAGMDVEVLDTGTLPLDEALAESLEGSPLELPDACFLLETQDEPEALARLAAVGERYCLPVVVSVPAEAAGEAWERLRAEEASRWLCAAVNPVVMWAERQGAVGRECFAPPALAVAALLAASFRDTRTFARLVGPGSALRAPAVWRPPGKSPVATAAGLSLHEQQRLAARGLVGVSGWWDSDAVQAVAAPTFYRGRDAAPLPAQLLTGRLVRLAQELAERLPAGVRPDAVSEVCTRAAEVFLPGGAGRGCELLGQVVPLGGGERGLHLRATLRPELAGTRLQLELTVPMRG